MPTVFRRANWKIAMYFRDHPPAHFHIVTSSRDEAQVGIETLSVLAGHVPRAVLAAALEWAETNVNELRDKWNELHPD